VSFSQKEGHPLNILIFFIRFFRNLLLQSKIIKSYFNFEHKNQAYSEIYSIIFGDFNLKIDSPKVNSNLSIFNEIILILTQVKNF